MPTDSQQAPPPSTRLMQCITGHWVASAVHVVAKLGVADHLKDGAKSSDELAAQLDCHASSLFRVLRAMTCLGILQENRPKHFSLTEAGELLRSDHPESMRSMALFQGARPHWHGWGELHHSVKTGQPAFEHVHGMGFFDYCLATPEFGEHFNGAMTGMSAMAAGAVLAAYDFSGIRKLVDVGGGHGYLISRILEKYPELQGGLVDLPDVAEGAKSTLGALGLTSRCEVVGGSFFDSLPPADAYIAKNIIHDWDDEHSRTILRNMRAAMEGNGRVILLEIVISPEVQGDVAMLIDLEMLHATRGGRERTEREFADLFEAAGLKLNRILSTETLYRVIEAVPVG
ncbi:MAG: methyltransferase [Planctomycetaceae bacterium]